KVTLNTTAVSDSFELKSFRVINANPYSYYNKQSSSIKKGSYEETNPENESLFNSWTDRYYIDTYASPKKGEPAYVFENWNLDPRRGNTTALIIAGIYKGKDNTNTEVTYYRFNLGGKAVRWALNRNTHYKVTITKVHGDGYTDEKETEEGEPGGKPTDPIETEVQITATIEFEPWEISDQNHDIGKD
ncbi:MAG: hypothetical protein ACRC9Q_05245, partial [Bacteroidales bacterium]